MKFVWVALLVLAGLASASAQTPPAAIKPAVTAAPAPVLTPAQAQAVLDVLQDETKRKNFVAVLQNMARVQAATAPHTGAALKPGSLGAELLAGASAAIGQASTQSVVMVRALTNFPMVWRWLSRTANDADSQARLLDAGWKLAVVVAVGGVAEFLCLRLLRRYRDGVNRTAPPEDASNIVPDTEAPAEGLARPRRPSAWALLRRVPYVLLRLLIDLAPVLTFGVVVYALLATPLGSVADTRLIILGLIDAYIAVRAIMGLTRMMLSPNSASLRLIHLSDRSAGYLTRWVRRIAVVAIFGYAIDQTGLLFGMDAAVHDAALKLIALVIHLFALIMVLQCRRRVARRLRPAADAHGAWPDLRRRLAAGWHVIAIFLIVALWLISAFEARRGYDLILDYLATAAGVLIVARLLSIVVAGALDRSLRMRPELAATNPDLEARAGRYHPLLRGTANVLITAAAAYVLLSLWGAPLEVWFRHGSLGGRVVSALLMSAFIVLLAYAVWEGVNGAIQSHLSRLTREAQAARSARLRTLLPMLRTTLLVVICIIGGLMVLSEIGVNTAPLLAGAGVLGLAIGFGSQKLVQDIITGLFLLLENAMQVGDVVLLASLTGTVETLSIRTIRLRAQDGAVHIIPFSAVTTVTNMTRDYSYAMLDVSAGLNEEPDRIIDIVRGVGTEMRGEPRWDSAIVDELEVLGVEKFLDNAWVLRLRLKVRPGQQWAVQREMNRRLKYRFDKLAIESPFTSSRVLSTVPAPPEPPAAPA